MTTPSKFHELKDFFDGLAGNDETVEETATGFELYGAGDSDTSPQWVM